MQEMPDTLSLIAMTWQYVQSAPHFWTGMGSLTAIAMFIGAMMYDGQLKSVMKFIVAVLPYTFFTLFIGIARKNDAVELASNIVHPEYVYASTITILSTTFCYLVGMLIGVSLFHLKYKDKLHA